ELALAGNDISSWDGLPALPALRFLSVQYNPIHSLRGFPFLPSLESIRVSDCDFTRGVSPSCVRECLCSMCPPSLTRVDDTLVQGMREDILDTLPHSLSLALRLGMALAKA
ncbi:hypothetical protein KIPB_016100, partial [Kipferlia bialata]